MINNLHAKLDGKQEEISAERDKQQKLLDEMEQFKRQLKRYDAEKKKLREDIEFLENEKEHLQDDLSEQYELITKLKSQLSSHHSEGLSEKLRDRETAEIERLADILQSHERREQELLDEIQRLRGKKPVVKRNTFTADDSPKPSSTPLRNSTLSRQPSTSSLHDDRPSSGRRTVTKPASKPKSKNSIEDELDELFG